MIFRLTSRPHQGVYSYAIRSSIWSPVILKKKKNQELSTPKTSSKQMTKLYVVIGECIVKKMYGTLIEHMYQHVEEGVIS